MSKAVENVDEAALEAAQELLGTKTSRDTVNAALREVVRQKIIDEFVANMANRDTEELEELRADAWR